MSGSQGSGNNGRKVAFQIDGGAGNETREGKPEPQDIQTGQSAEGVSPSAGASSGVVVFKVLAQFIKDLSYEQPSVEASLGKKIADARSEVNADVRPRKIDDKTYEISIALKAHAKTSTQTLFILELVYSGVFRLENIPKERLPQIIMAECPRLLFPYLRQITASLTQNGPYPALVLDPIDFARLYHQRLAKTQESSEGGSDTSVSGAGGKTGPEEELA